MIIAAAGTRLEFTLLGIFVSLIVKGSIDALFSEPLKASQTARDVMAILRRPTTFQFAMLLFTLIRFMYGANRFYEAESQRSPRYILWNMFVMMLLFILFYFAGLAVLQSRTFFS